MKMNVRMKVMASVGSVVLLLAILGVLAIYNLNSIRAEFEGLLLATSVERDALGTIMAEKDYIQHEEEKYYEEAKSKVDAINGYLDEIDRTSTNEELLANSRKARKGTNDYAELYHKGVAALKHNAEGALILQDAGQKVTDQAEAFVKAKQALAENTQLMQQINICTDVWNYALQIRMKEKEYMLHQKAEDFENMKENFALMVQKLDELEKISPDSKDQERIRIARENAGIYEKAAYEWVEGRRTLAEEILPAMKTLGEGVISVAQEASSGASGAMISTQEASNSILVIGMIVGLVLGMGIAFVMGGKLSKPVKQVAEVTELIDKEFDAFAVALEAVANNDLTVQIAESEIELLNIKSNDEVGDLAKAFNGTIESKIKLTEALKKTITNLNAMVRQMNSNASELVAASTEISSSSEQMSKGAQDQAQQVEQVSTAIEEITSTIIESSKNAGDATEASKKASENATTGGQIISDTIHGMQKIGDVVRESSDSIGKLAKSAEQIGEIIGVIDDIADQTNLLALNAAIEAARAGEQGRGFAVVADEVRKLAERTGKATGEITGMVKGIQNQTGEAVGSMETGISEVDKGRELVDKAGNSINEIVSMNERVLSMIQQMATASEEQSAAAEQISKNVEHISSVTKETASGAEQSAAAAEELNRQAEGLKEMVGRFKISTETQEETPASRG